MFNYGILDGGHTYTAIIANRDRIPKTIEKYVRVEVVTNVVNITRLSDARNTSVQVSDIALFNLEDSFVDIKEVIKKEPYADKITYKDNEDKAISISELLRLMYAFDIKKYTDDSVASIQSYSGKAQVFKRYKEMYSTSFYKSLTKELPALVKLYDIIEKDMANKYNDYKKKLGTANPKFGLVKGVDSLSSPRKTTFLGNMSNYSISSGYIYPVFGAFRALLKFRKESEEVEWIFDPIEIWNEVGSSIIQNTFESNNNPRLAGKDKQLWLSNYSIVETQSLRKQL